MTDEQWILHIKERLHALDRAEITTDDWRKEILKMQKEGKEKYAE